MALVMGFFLTTIFLEGFLIFLGAALLGGLFVEITLVEGLDFEADGLLLHQGDVHGLEEQLVVAIDLLGVFLFLFIVEEVVVEDIFVAILTIFANFGQESGLNLGFITA